MNIRKIAKKLKNLIGERIPIKNYILFESIPDLSDNTKPVFDQMINQEVNKKYKLVWVCFDGSYDKKSLQKNVKYINGYNKWVLFYYKYSAKVVICCNRFIGVNKIGQMNYYLMHGSPIKNTSGYYRCPQYIDYMITAGDYMNSKSAVAMGIDERKCIPLGYPRNDILVKVNLNISKIMGEFKKYIIWYPTVKQQKNGIDYGIKPISFMDNLKNIEHLNEYAKKLDVLIIIKPHFAQIENIAITDLSNIKIINDQFYRENRVNPYEFMGACDALLSDYSSVFYDYMLCNKPIGLVWNDIDEFKNNVGLFDFYEEVTSGCEKIYKFDDLLDFIKKVAEDRDDLCEEREQVCKLVNSHKDGKNAKRVVDFILKTSELKI